MKDSTYGVVHGNGLPTGPMHSVVAPLPYMPPRCICGNPWDIACQLHDAPRDGYGDMAAGPVCLPTPNDIQHGGDHYQKLPIQTWDYIHENDIGYLAGNVIKYVTRYKDKNGLEDLKKARHYLDKLIEVNTPK